MQLIRNLASFSRIRTSFLICLHLGLSILVSNYENDLKNDLSLYIHITIGVLCLILCYINAACVNDYADKEIDVLNDLTTSDRPLVNNRISKKNIFLIYIFSTISSLTLAAFLSLKIFILILLVLVFNCIYSLKPVRLSYRGGLAIATLPFVYVLVPFFIGQQISKHIFSFNLMVISLSFYLLFCSRLILKDFRDIKGDTIYSKRTFLIRHGKLKTITASITLQILGLISITFIDVQFKISICLAVLFLTTNSIISLLEILKHDDFKQQGPILSMFGRLQTGILFCFISFFILLQNSTQALAVNIVLTSVCLLTVITAREIFIKGSIKQVRRLNT
ncbi:MAG: UbiA family prenyltransferase [Acidimicrobiia bacterium]